MSEKTTEDIKKELQENPKYKDFFSRYSEYNVKNFIGHYAHIKHMYTTYAGLYESKSESAIFGMMGSARAGLAEILQKKLFNAQCLWRAEKLELKEVQQTRDFNYWEKYIYACPFIDPITQEDIELYKNYLNSLNTGEPGWFISPQDYDEFKDAIENNEEGGIYPEWYAFYDTYKGTGMLIKLPDVRGEKEEFYRNLHFDAVKEKQIKDGTYKEYVPRDKSKDLSAYKDKDVEKFIKECETREEMEQWKNYRDTTNNENDAVDDALRLLQDARETVPIQANSDWKEAVLDSARVLKNRLTARALPLAYEEYKMKMETGISFYEKIEPRKEDHLCKMVKEQIIHGKELNGEPKDLNF